MSYLEVKLKELTQKFMGPVKDELTDIWEAIGIIEEQKIDRTDSLCDLISEFISGIVIDENKLCESLKESVFTCEEQLKTLSSQLGETVFVHEKLSLLEKEKFLRNKLGELEKEKYARLKEYKYLSQEEKKLCELLVMPVTALLDSSSLPNKQALYELQENVRMLAEEKERRYKKFCHVKQELTTIMEVTECSPETEFERGVVCYDNDEDFILSNENLEQVNQVLQKFKKRKIEMEKELNELKQKLKDLWSRLKLEDNERTLFVKKYKECKQSSISALKSEIARCEEIKKQNIGTYISKLKEELVELWQKCYVSEEERLKFDSLDDTNYTDELLELFDQEVERLKKYYESTRNIFENIEKRKVLWQLMLTLEKKGSDPNRFNNRGGNLLQEERERKRLLKELPQLEEDILQAIGKYEEDNDEVLLIFGVNFAEFIKEQWDKHNKAKENQKLERQKLRALVSDQATTPRKRTLLSTPASAPCKVSRMNLAGPSSCVSIRTRRLVKATPSPFRSRRQSGKTSRWVSPRYVPNKKTPVSKVLIERNEQPVVKVSNSTALNATSYSQFATELNKNTRYNCRSSVLSSSKVVLGSKICRSGYPRESMRASFGKSSNYPLRSSTKLNTSTHNKTSKTPVKLTPARGKQGLPFIL